VKVLYYFISFPKSLLRKSSKTIGYYIALTASSRSN